MTQYRKSLTLFLAYIVVFELLVILVGDIVRPDWSHWSDEWHFQNTIKRFGEDISLYNLKHYEEMSTPVPFLLYALWGRLVGFDLFHLRILSVIIAIVTYLTYHRILFDTLGDRVKSFAGAAFLAIQPYMIGFSIFVFTDMTAILFLLLSCLGHIHRRPVLFGASMALAILSRQYMIFLTLAAGVFYTIEYWHHRKEQTANLLVGCIASVIPYLFLAVWWGGTTPDNSLRWRYLDSAFTFHGATLSLYICLLFVLLVPLILFYAKRFYRDYRIWIGSLVASAFYVIFPVQPTQPTIETGVTTVGLFHRLLTAASTNDTWIHVVFYLCFLLAMPVLFKILGDCYVRIRHKVYDIVLFLDLATLSFLTVMPFSYLAWEKYFLPLVPLVILRMLLPDDPACPEPAPGL